MLTMATIMDSGYCLILVINIVLYTQTIYTYTYVMLFATFIRYKNIYINIIFMHASIQFAICKYGIYRNTNSYTYKNNGNFTRNNSIILKRRHMYMYIYICVLIVELDIIICMHWHSININIYQIYTSCIFESHYIFQSETNNIIIACTCVQYFTRSININKCMTYTFKCWSIRTPKKIAILLLVLILLLLLLLLKLICFSMYHPSILGHLYIYTHILIAISSYLGKQLYIKDYTIGVEIHNDIFRLYILQMYMYVFYVINNHMIGNCLPSKNRCKQIYLEHRAMSHVKEWTDKGGTGHRQKGENRKMGGNDSIKKYVVDIMSTFSLIAHLCHLQKYINDMVIRKMKLQYEYQLYVYWFVIFKREENSHNSMIYMYITNHVRMSAISMNVCILVCKGNCGKYVNNYHGEEYHHIHYHHTNQSYYNILCTLYLMSIKNCIPCTISISCTSLSYSFTIVYLYMSCETTRMKYLCEHKGKSRGVVVMSYPLLLGVYLTYTDYG